MRRVDDDKLAFKQALKTSGVDSIIKKLPRKSKTLIGEKGYKLSGGERQRIGIARTLYKPSEILVLDEATSSLDSKTEKKIQEGIDKINGTVIIIAHRLSTLKNVDKIVFLERGKIIEQGSYSDLIKKKGKFYELHKLQQKKN